MRGSRGYHVRTKSPFRYWDWRGCIAVIAAALTWWVIPPAVLRDAAIDPSGESESVNLPNATNVNTTNGKKTFTAEIVHSSWDSERLWLVPKQGCIDAVRIDGIEYRAIWDSEDAFLCSSFFADLSGYIKDGRNRLSVTVACQESGCGIDFVPAYPFWSLVLMAGLASAGLFRWTTAASNTRVPSEVGSVSGILGREERLQADAKPESPVAWRILALPFAGASLLAAVLANEYGTGWIWNHALHVLVAVTIALALLLRIVCKEWVGLVSSTASWPLAAASVASFIYAAWIMHDLEWTEWNTTHASIFATAGSVAGMFAYVRTLEALRWCAVNPKAVCIAVVTSLSPSIFYSFHTILWQWTAGTTVAMVKSLLWLCGIVLISNSHTVIRPNGIQGNFVQTIQSVDFAVNIAWQCSGLEGLSIFCFLISVFILYDWHLFGKLKRLWVAYLLAAAVVLVVNAARIASIFLYAEWTLAHEGDTSARWSTIDAFHSNAGLVLYTAVFAMTLPLLYRWARRNSRVR